MIRRYGRRYSGILPGPADSPETRNLKVTALLVSGAFVLMLLVAGTVFFLTLKGPEVVLVPDVVGDESRQYDVINAMVRLQEKGLTARVQLKHSSAYAKGTVIDQRPRPGSVVRAGRRIVLTVSEGPIVSSVGSYVGKTLTGVRLELKEIFPRTEDALIRINEPVMYIHDESEPGTVIEQSPDPETPVREGEVTLLDLVVSRGPRGELYETQNYLGLPFQEVVQTLADGGAPFTFRTREAASGEPDGIVVSQEPEPGQQVSEDTSLILTMTPPRRLPRGRRFGLFTAELVQYPIRVKMELIARTVDGDEVIVSMRHPGGMIGIPYIVDEEAQILFFVNDREWNPATQ